MIKKLGSIAICITIAPILIIECIKEMESPSKAIRELIINVNSIYK